MSAMRTSIFVMVVAMTVPPVFAQRPGPERMEGVQAVRDLEYARVGDKTLLLDLYLPEKATGPLPVIVGIHGGGWANGSKAAGQGSWLARHGYAVAVINYRLSGEAIFPAQIEDCKAAVRWLRANAKKYNLDPDRFGATGHSAGGHLTSLLATAGDVKEFDKGDHLEFSGRIQAACPMSGPTDFLQMDAHAPPGTRLKHDAPNSPEARLIGGPIQDNKDKTAKANPTGLFTRLFAKSVGPKGKVYAVDIVREFVKHIEKACREQKLDNVEGVLCTDRSVELPAASVDAAFICDTYHHFEFPARTMASIHKALKPGGRLVLIDFHRIEGRSSAFVLGHVRAGQEVFVKEIETAGFKHTREETFLKENYFVCFEKVAPPQDARPRYVSNLMIGYSQVSQWYPGFESVVDNDHWELLWHGGAGVDKWSDPDFSAWSRAIKSPCKVRSGDPDRVVLSISGPYGDDVDAWTKKIEETIKVIRAKYKNVQQVVLQPVVGGPGASRAARQHPVIVKAIERIVKADQTRTVSSGPSPVMESDKDFRDALGHLTREAAGPIGKQIGEHYKQLDAKSASPKQTQAPSPKAPKHLKKSKP